MDKKYYLYEIRNIINNKIYIGIHATNNLDDGYMGSGKLLKRAIEKHGIENFNKKILSFYDSLDKLLDAEKTIVNEDFIKRNDTYNISIGGWGWYHENSNSSIQKRKRLKLDEKLRDTNFKKKFGDKISKGLKRFYANNPDRKKILVKRLMEIQPSFAGKKHTKETKEKIGMKNSINQRGTNNSQYGTCWIYCIDRQKSIKIKKNELKKYIDNGWIKGRKMF